MELTRHRLILARDRRRVLDARAHLGQRKVTHKVTIPRVRGHDVGPHRETCSDRLQAVQYNHAVPTYLPYTAPSELLRTVSYEMGATRLER